MSKGLLWSFRLFFYFLFVATASADGYVLTLWGRDYSDQKLDEVLGRIKTSGAKTVAVAHFGCQTDIHSSDVGACELRPYDLAIRTINRAQQVGLEANILPLMAGKKWEWRGYFNPSDVDQWFSNYTAWIKAIAVDAEKLKLKELVVGSEMSILQKNSQQWRKLIKEIRKVFSGAIVFTVNWDSLNLDFWDEVDAIGVSAYFSLSKAKDPSQEVLDQAWAQKKKMLMDISNKNSRPLHITEVGYTNSTAAAATPWATPADALRDDALQARCFEAFRRAWDGEDALMRVNVWSVNNPDEVTRDILADPIGKPAESVLKEFFNRR